MEIKVKMPLAHNEGNQYHYLDKKLIVISQKSQKIAEFVLESKTDMSKNCHFLNFEVNEKKSLKLSVYEFIEPCKITAYKDFVIGVEDLNKTHYL